MWWIALVGCGTGPEATGTETDAVVTDTDIDTATPQTDTAAPTTDTSTTDTATPDDGFPAVTPADVDCATVQPSGPSYRPSGTDPVPFAPRSDGTAWFATREGVAEGVDPDGAALVYPGDADVVRESPYGTLYWVGAPEIWRVVPGGSPELLTAGLLEDGNTVQDLALHPHGTLAWATVTFGGVPTYSVSTLDPSGTLSTEPMPTAPTPVSVHAVAWAHDWRSMWLAAQQELYRVDVDPDGLPDWTTLTLETTLPVPSTPFGDLAVDACGGVWVHVDLGFGLGGVARYDPADGSLTPVQGNVDHGYGWAPLRFGRAPGEEHRLITMRGGWGTPMQDWMWWDAGVGAPAWP